MHHQKIEKEEENIKKLVAYSLFFGGEIIKF
jgi:hypothetical protein